MVAGLNTSVPPELFTGEIGMSCSEVFRYVCNKYRWCEKILLYVVMLQGIDESHGLPHTVRVLCNVYSLLERLGRVNIDEESLVLATLLHDIGRGLEDYLGMHHAIISAELAQGILSEIGIRGAKSAKIRNMILEHSFSLGKRPSTPEACILSDADKLDALGAIGVYRLIETSSMRGRLVTDTLAHVWDKLVKLPSLMCFEESRKIAEEKLGVLLAYVRELSREVLVYEDAVSKAFEKAFSLLEKQGNRSRKGQGEGSSS